MKKPTPALINYFSNTTTIGLNEIAVANKVRDAFGIKSWKDLWKIKAGIRYITDERLDVKQLMQKLDFTMYTLMGDCEDIARAQIVVAKTLRIPVYYLMVFPDSTLQNGHVMVLGLTDKNNLFVLNYTKYYVETSSKLTMQDIEGNTEAFQNAFFKILGNLYRDQKHWQIIWVVKTNLDEIPTGYIELPPTPQFGDVETYEYPDDPKDVEEALKKLNLDELIPVTEKFPWSILAISLVGVITAFLIGKLL